MDAIKTSNEFVVLEGIPTPVHKCGEWPEDKSGHRLLFLIIPGNPGVAEYYDNFMEHLYRSSNYRIPAWAVSHTGHAKVKLTKSLKHLANAHEESYTKSLSLEEQIKAKLEFIQDYVPPDVKLILIGHSIGCYMILRLLDEVSSHHIMKCFLLFPTIERMASTPNGLFVTPFLKYLRWLAVWFVHILSYLSPQVKYSLIRCYFGSRTLSSCMYNASMQVFDPTCFRNMLFMADLEMQQVKDLDVDSIQRHISKLSFYYGQEDAWCPKEFFYEIQKKIPDADARLCDKGYEHAFVLRASKEMAQVVWNWFKPDLHQLQS